MYKVVLLRHGQSQWNLENRFTGWHDVDLTDQGQEEARSAGQVLKEVFANISEEEISQLQKILQTIKVNAGGLVEL